MPKQQAPVFKIFCYLYNILIGIFQVYYKHKLNTHSLSLLPLIFVLIIENKHIKTLTPQHL